MIAGCGDIMSTIPALSGAGEEDNKFEANVDHIVKPNLKKNPNILLIH